MRSGISRRNILKGMATTALTPALLPMAAAQSGEKPWWLGDGMPQEGAGTPKIATAINIGGGASDEAIRGVVQLGVYHVLSGGPAIPWTADQLQPMVDKLKAGGVRNKPTDDTEIIGSWLVKGATVAGESKRKLSTAVQASKDAAAEAIRDNKIPRKYEGAVKKYFGGMEQVAGTDANQP